MLPTAGPETASPPLPLPCWIPRRRLPGFRSARRRRGQAGGRPPAFDQEAYKQRNTVERCINRLKQWRGIATRYEKTATIYLSGLHFAAIFI
ncbi:hypothetical protein GCM10023237_69070 [Streptomyces coeruleoprunus]